LTTFEEIYKAYSERILNLVYRMISNEEVARDLTQDIFIKVYKNLSTFNQQSQLYTWIHAIAVNHVLNYLKHEKRTRWLNFMNDDSLKMIHHKGVEPSILGQTSSIQPDKIMEQNERANIVWTAVQSLSPKYRIPLVLFHYESISYKEISEMMKLSMSAVESRIHRAKKQLIKKLEPLLDQI
jgi:RNA polymerase sigma-70 factor (ECF subfamily)